MSFKFVIWCAINAAFGVGIYLMSWWWRIALALFLASGALLELFVNADFQNYIHPVKRDATVAIPVPLPRPGNGLLRSFDVSPRAEPEPEAAGGVPSIRVLTWNIERGYQLPAITARLKALQPDILLLQEVDIDCKRTGNVDVAAELSRSLSLPYVYFTTEHFVGEYSQAVKFDLARDSTGAVLSPAAAVADRRTNSEAAAAADTTFDEKKSVRRNAFGAHGNAILSRYPFIETWTYTLPSARGYYGGFADDRDTEYPNETDPAAVAAAAANTDADAEDAPLIAAGTSAGTGAAAISAGPNRPRRRSPPLCSGGYRPHDLRFNQRAVACARILTPQAGTIAVWSVHLDANFCGARGRARQYHALMSNVTSRTRRGDSVIIAGDFNTMNNGYRRFIYKFACDDLRWNSLGSTEAEWFAANVLSHYPQLTDPTANQTTLRILNGLLASDKLDWLLFSKSTLRLLTPNERKQLTKPKLYGKDGSAAAGSTEESWHIAGYDASDHCFVVYDLTTVDADE